MSIFSKFFFTLFGSSILAWLRDFVSRVVADGGTLSDQGHTKEVYADTYPYGPTLIQSCDSGGSTAQNFAVGSEDISNATYWFVASVTATSNAEPNPFGGSGVTLVAETGSTTAKGFYQQSAYQASIVSGQAYTVSAYVKKGDGSLAPDVIQVTYLSGGFGTDFYANYNINTGVVTKVNGGFADIEDVGGGWYRISLAGVATATGALGTFVFAFANNDPNATRFPAYTGNVNRDVYIWGVQFVQGNEPGEYIKTTTAAIDSIGTLYSLIPSQNLLLYQYTGAAAAYSLRSLSAGTINVVKVRRSGDNAELDFTASQVSDGALAAWVRAGGGTEDGFVTTWYDQSGNTNNATQTTAANQPKIVSSGTLVTEGGSPALLWPDYNSPYNLTNSSFNQSHPLTFFAAVYFNGTSGRQDYIFDSDSATSSERTSLLHPNSEDVNKFGLYGGKPLAPYYFSETNADLTAGQKIFSVLFNASSSYIYKNSVLGTSGASPEIVSTSMNGITIGNFNSPNPSYSWSGKIHELVVYNSDQSANRTGIEANINAHYNIYP